MLNNAAVIIRLLSTFIFVVICFLIVGVAAAHDATIPTFEKGPTEAAYELMQKRVVMITLDKLLLEDLLNCSGPLLRGLLNESAVSLMNANTAGLPGTDGGYSTIGAGARLQGHSIVRLAFNRDESWQQSTAKELYRLHTGAEKTPPGAVIHPYLMNLVELNEPRPYPAHVGLLGETLGMYGLAAAVIGNADSDEPGRQAVSIAMDRSGAVTFGDVGSTLLRKNEHAPYGVSSDSGAYLEVLQDVWQKSSLIVVEWGDSSRIDAYRDYLPRERREQLLESSFKEFDQFLGGVLTYLDEQTLLILLSPSPPLSVSGNGQRMTPLVVYDPSKKEGGLLVSGTTRRPGIVTNMDIAPAVLQHLGLNAPFFVWGAPLKHIYTPAHLEELTAVSTHTARIFQQRPPIIRGFILALIVASLLGVLAVIVRFRFLYKLRYIHCVLLNFPAVLFLAALLPPFPAAHISHSLLWLVIIAVPVITPALLLLRRNLMLCFAYSGLIICALLLFDLWQGGVLNSRSLLGYDPISGARFYGIGNEYMGVLVGSFILGFVSLFSLQGKSLQKYKTAPYVLTASLFATFALLLVYFMASPVFGANFGGTFTAGFALAVTLVGLLLLPGGRRAILKMQCLLQGKMGHNKMNEAVLERGWLNRPRLAVMGFLVLCITVTAMFVYYLNNPGSGDPVSHLGRTWELVRSDGLPELGNVALRKVEMNLKLLRFSLWSRVLLGFIALLAILYYYPVGLMRSVFKREPFFKAILAGTIGGSVAAFCLNDSGVVAAATVMLYGGLPLFMLSLREVFS